MNNKLIKKEDLSIFDKVKAFFRNFFHKKFSREVNLKCVNDFVKQPNDFSNNIKVDILNANIKERELNKFISEIESNPSIIEKLSNDKLDKLIKYYEKITDVKKQKIQRLKSSLY